MSSFYKGRMHGDVPYRSMSSREGGRPCASGWEDAWDAEKAVEVMMRKKPKTVGLVGLGNMSAALYENVKKGLPKVNVINATDLVDEIRMVKSEEDLSLHREAAYMHEMSYELAKEALEPGRTIEEIILDVRIAQMEAGSEEQQVAIAFGQPGAPHMAQMSWSNTYIRRPRRSTPRYASRTTTL